jgi:hypothetical protein
MSLLSESKVGILEVKQARVDVLVADDISNPFVMKSSVQGIIQGPALQGVSTKILDSNGNDIVLPEDCVVKEARVRGTTTFVGFSFQLEVVSADLIINSEVLSPVNSASVNVGCVTSAVLVSNTVPGVNVLGFKMVGNDLPPGDIIHVTVGYYEQ